MGNTKIEYLDKTWNFYTGCRNWQNGVCPVGEKCWAKAIDKRFSRSFEPQLNLKVLNERLVIRKPSRIGVCFTGDLFGDWVNHEMQVRAPFHHWEVMPLREMVFNIILNRQKHQFFFLTKCPQNYKNWGKFPDNAWVGASANYAAPLGMALWELGGVDCKHKWLSIEPLMGEIKIGNLQGVDWVVMGGWSQGKIQPKPEWIGRIVSACDKSNIPVFLKNNLIPMIDELPDNCFTKTEWGEMNLRQEFPV